MPADDQATSETQLRRLIEEQAQAVREKDVEASLANYAPDVVSFDVVNPLRKIGLEACRNGWRNGSPRLKGQSATNCAI